MHLLDFNLRTIENKDWATLLFVLALGCIVLTKSFFETRFQDYIRLLFSDKYSKIYKDSSYLVSGFNILLFIVNIITLAFIIQVFLEYFKNGDKTDYILYIRIITLLFVFILSKYLLEKIIAIIFDIEEVIERFNLHKVNFRIYVGLLLFPFSAILYYGNYLTKNIIIAIIISVFAINIVSYFILLKNYQKIIFSKFFYFILYLCALEIAPYYFIYYLIAKK